MTPPLDLLERFRRRMREAGISFRLRQLRWYHEPFGTPDDLDECPLDLGGGAWNP